MNFFEKIYIIIFKKCYSCDKRFNLKDEIIFCNSKKLFHSNCFFKNKNNKKLFSFNMNSENLSECCDFYE